MPMMFVSAAEAVVRICLSSDIDCGVRAFSTWWRGLVWMLTKHLLSASTALMAPFQAGWPDVALGPEVGQYAERRFIDHIVNVVLCGSSMSHVPVMLSTQRADDQVEKVAPAWLKDFTTGKAHKDR